jgi:hypothetical protein
LPIAPYQPKIAVRILDISIKRILKNLYSWRKIRMKRRRKKRVGKRELKKQLDWLLSFVNGAEHTQRDLREFLAFLFGEEEREEVYLQYADYIKQHLPQIRMEIKQYLEELIQETPPVEWQALLVFDGWRFSVAYGVYRKGDKLKVRPTLGQRIRVGTTQLDDSLMGNVQYRLFSLLAQFSLHSIRTCPDCESLYYTPMDKKNPLCRRCQQNEEKRKWERANRVALQMQKDHLEATGERLPIARFREE